MHDDLLGQLITVRTSRLAILKTALPVPSAPSGPHELHDMSCSATAVLAHPTRLSFVGRPAGGTELL